MIIHFNRANTGVLERGDLPSMLCCRQTKLQYLVSSISVSDVQCSRTRCNWSHFLTVLSTDSSQQVNIDIGKHLLYSVKDSFILRVNALNFCLYMNRALHAAHLVSGNCAGNKDQRTHSKLPVIPVNLPDKNTRGFCVSVFLNFEKPFDKPLPPTTKIM